MTMYKLASTKSLIGTTVVAAAIAGLSVLPAHADAPSAIVAAVQAQIYRTGSDGLPAGPGPGGLTGSGYQGGPNQSNSVDGQEWCADFAGWAWAQGGASDLGVLSDAAASFYDYGTRYGTLSSTPAPGDAVVFSYSASQDWAAHVEIVTSVSGGSITAIGGNENNEVEQDSFGDAVGTSTYNGTISGYIAPVVPAGPPSVPAVTGSLESASTVVNPANGHLVTYVRDSGGHLWSVDPQGAGWTDFGVAAAGNPTTIVNPLNGHLVTYVRGVDDHLMSVDPQGAGWTDFGKVIVGNPMTVVNPVNDHLVTYVRDANNHLWSVDPQGAGWTDFGATAAGNPYTVVNPANNHLVTYVNGINNHLWSVDPQGAGWTDFGAVIAGDPHTIVNPANNHLVTYIQNAATNDLESVDPQGAGWVDFKMAIDDAAADGH